MHTGDILGQLRRHGDKRRADGEPLTEAFLGVNHSRVGRVHEARAILEVLKRRQEASCLSSVCIAWVHTGLDEPDEAMKWHEQAYRDRDGLGTYRVICRAVTPLLYQGILTDPRFLDLLRWIEEGGKE